MTLTWQPSLLDAVEPGFDPAFAGADRRDLGDGAWLEVVPGWVHGADALFARVLDTAPWAEHERPMYDQVVVEPRLTTGLWFDPPEPVAAMAEALSERYDRDLCKVSANLYRNGRDSVAWHGDRVGRTRADTVVAIVSLGSARRFLLRPVGGGESLRLLPAPGDLLVLGGTAQTTWQHSVPKVKQVGARVSLMFREAY
ncbi:MAG TPA: alpha-ketoglutarate-dependent dioxygenase AlkB [Acidimicrobiales bacterium]